MRKTCALQFVHCLYRGRNRESLRGERPAREKVSSATSSGPDHGGRLWLDRLIAYRRDPQTGAVPSTLSTMDGTNRPVRYRLVGRQAAAVRRQPVPRYTPPPTGIEST